MYVLISDYREQMEEDYSLTIEAIKNAVPEEIRKDLHVIVAAYQSKEFNELIGKAEGLITAFLPIDDNFLAMATKLKFISINAAGFSNVEMAAVKKRGIAVARIREYCTREVAEHAIAMLFALNNNIKAYDADIKEGNWNYNGAPMRPTLDKLTVVIYGFGKIGKSTCTLVKALGGRVCFVDPYVSVEEGSKFGAIKMSEEEVYEEADVIINHMALTNNNYHLFNYQFFLACKRKPIFINVGRGGCVDEAGLLKALDEKLLYGAGLDVLEDENPDLSQCEFVDRIDVVLTPHAAFYSKNSMERLHNISGKNLGYLISGQKEKVDEVCID